MRYKFFTYGLILWIGILLAGCTTYLPPEQGPVAFLGKYDFFETKVSVFDDSIECEGGPHPLHSLFSLNSKRFVPIPANKPLTLKVVTYYSNWNIIPRYDNLTFIPEAGQQYVVAIKKIENKKTVQGLFVFKVVHEKNGSKSYHSIHFIRRTPGLIAACNDKNMKENIKKISTSYQKI